jgi:hypothetical protein
LPILFYTWNNVKTLFQYSEIPESPIVEFKTELGVSAHLSLRNTDHKYDLFLRRIKEVESENSVWLAVTNRGDIESGITENCWYHLHALNVSNYLFMAVDEWSFNYLTCKGINSHWDPFVWKEEFSTGALRFSDNPKTPYQKLMSARLDFVDVIVKSDIDVFFSDTDVVWMKNAFKDINSNSKQHDIVFLHDGKVPSKGFPTNHVALSQYKAANPSWNRVNIFEEPDIQSNAGSFFMRSNERTKLFWSSVLEIDAKMQKKMKVWSDQRSIAYALKRNDDVRWKLESRSTWINGWTIKNEFKNDLMCTRSSASWTLVHMNYNKGQKRKKYHFRRCGMWTCLSDYCLGKKNQSNACVPALLRKN